MPNLDDYIIPSPEFDYEAFEVKDETNLIPKLTEDRRNTNPLLVAALAGTMIWSTPCDASMLRQSIFNETEFAAGDYNKLSSSLFNYVTEIEQKVFVRRYSKKQLIREICSFKILNNNWDGYGALPVEVESATNVMHIIDLLGEDNYSSINKIYPNPNGTISIIWSNELGETISLEIGNKSMSYYVDFCSQETEFFDNLDINDSEITKLSGFIKSIVF